MRALKTLESKQHTKRNYEIPGLVFYFVST